MLHSIKAFAVAVWTTLLVAAMCMPHRSAVLAEDLVNPVFKLGTPTYFGSGCPKETISMVTSFDAQTVSVLFSQFGATAVTSTRDRKTCDLMVPVQTLPGITIGIFKADFRGYTYVPDAVGSFVELTSNYFFAGFKGPTYKQHWGPGMSTDVFLATNMTATAITWSPCKTSTTLRINTAITAGRSSFESPLDSPEISIDSVDLTVEKGIEFFLTYKTCK